MTQEKYSQEILKAESMRSVSQGTEIDYWAGYERGVRRAYFGDLFGTEDEHTLYVAAADSADPQRAALGRGYREGLLAESK